MKRTFRFLGVLTLAAMLGACGSDDGDDGGSVSNADYKQACENGVTLCKDDPTYGQMFGGQDCSTTAIETAYAGCDAADCAAFAACVSSP
jgi:hypothetical protein